MKNSSQCLSRSVASFALLAVAATSAVTLILSSSAASAASTFSEAQLSKSFVKFQSNDALVNYLRASPSAERIHPELLWVLDDARSLARKMAQESTLLSDVVPGSLAPNRAFQLPVDKESFANEKPALDPKISPFLNQDFVEGIFDAPKLDNRLWGVSRIQAPSVWSVTQGENVTVAVVDTGVDRSHPALSSRIKTNSAELGGAAGVDDDGNGYVDDVYGWNFFDKNAESADNQGHGSHVSGTVAGDLASKDFFGVAPKAEILAVKTHDSSGASREDAVVKGILYAADQGAQVINCSWGGAPEAADYSQVLFDAIDYANKKGSLVVAAAGNDSSNNDTTASYPANYELPNVLSVAATSSNDRLAFFSNYGKRTVPIAAPGAGVYSVKNGGGYVQQSGTSMAAPHAAGAAALVFSKLQAQSGPGGAPVDPALVRQLLLDSAKTDVGYSNKVSRGFLDVSFLLNP